MDTNTIELASLLAKECGWPFDLESLDDPFDSQLWKKTHHQLGLPDDIKFSVTGYKFRPPEGFEEKMRIYFLSIEGTGRLHITRLRAILKELAREGKRSRPETKTEKNAALDVGVEDIIFVCSLLEPKNTTRYFCHFQDKENGKRPKLMIGPKWEDAQPEAEKERAVAILRKQLQWPDNAKDIDAWRDEWSKAFTVEHLYVPRTSKELAIRLARFAAEIRESIPEMHKIEKQKGPIHTLHKAFREALIKDMELSDFADMIAQTITYGLFSARATGTKLSGIETLAACIPSTNPFLRDLFSEFALLSGDKPTDLDFDDLSLNELVEMLNAADIDAIIGDFGTQFKGGKEDPVIHFYETFLKEYDNDLKCQKGVFYTPQAVVSFIVKSVDEQLRLEFGLEDGLADTATWGEVLEHNHELNIPNGISSNQAFVQILDPSTGTGTFLSEIILLIHETMIRKWNGKSKKEIQTLWNSYVTEHLLTRLYGYELMMAPYSVAHLKIGLILNQTGYQFIDNQRLNIYLTNTLEPASIISKWIPDFLAEETKAVNAIKQDLRFTVIIGNPPYSPSMSKPKWIMKLLDDWKVGLKETKSDLNREEWKFLRFAQYHCIKTGAGIVGFVINRDFLDGITKRRMREHLGETFPLRIVVDLNGDVKGNIADENVFDIMQGVAIVLLSTHHDEPQLNFSSRIGKKEEKRKDLLEKKTIDSSLTVVDVHAPYFRWVEKTSVHKSAEKEYIQWPAINSIFNVMSSGIQTKRDALCVAFSEKEMWNRILRFHELPVEQARK